MVALEGSAATSFNSPVDKQEFSGFERSNWNGEKSLVEK